MNGTCCDMAACCPWIVAAGLFVIGFCFGTIYGYRGGRAGR